MANQTEKLQVILEAKANVRQAEAEMGRLLGGLGEWVKGGIGIEIGRRITNALAQIPVAFKQAIGDGIEFNAMMERNRIALAASLRTGSPESFPTFNEALRESAGLFSGMRKAAVDAGVDIQVVSEVMAAMTGIMARAGIPLQRQVQLTAALAGAVQTLGLKGQHLTEIRSILSGTNLQTSMLAKVLNMDAASIAAAKESGKFFELMMDRLKGFSEGATEAKNSYDGLWSRIKAITAEAGGKATEGLFGDAKAMMGAASRSGTPAKVGTAFNDFYVMLATATKNLANLAISIAPGEIGKTAEGRMITGQRADRIRAFQEMAALRNEPGMSLWGLFGRDEWRRKTTETRGVPVSPASYGPPVPAGWDFSKGRVPMPITDESTAEWELWTELEKKNREDAAKALKEARSKARSEFAGISSALLDGLKPQGSQGFYLTSGMAAASNESLRTQRSMLDVLKSIHMTLSQQTWGMNEI